MIPVATYSRVSDPSQERGTSLDNQKRRCLEYCRTHHYTVIASESESEGGEFIHARSRFHSLVARSDIQKIIVDIPDRLGRGKARSILEYIAAEAGKEIEYATPQPDGDTIAGMAATLAQDLGSGVERLNMRRRMMEGRNSRARQGRIIAGRQAPYGYNYDTKRDHRGRVVSCELIIDETKADTYRMIVDWFLVGIKSEGLPPLSMRGICKRLTFTGVPTPSPKTTEWSYQTVFKILRNPVYKGQWEYGRNAWRLEDRKGGAKARIINRRGDDETIVVKCPAIIDAEKWNAIQARLADNAATKFSPPTKRTYLLRGLVTCAACGCKLVGEGRKSGNGEMLTYYTCHQRRHKWSHPCRAGLIRSTTIEEATWEAIEGLTTSDEMPVSDASKRNKKQPNYAASIQAQKKVIKDAETELRRLSRLMVGRDDNAPTMKIYREQEREIEARIVNAQATLEKIEEDEARAKAQREVVRETSELKAEIAERIASTPADQRRFILERLHTRCVYDSTKRLLTVACVFGSVTVSI